MPESGAVLISEATARRVQSAVRLKALGTARLLDRTVLAFEVLGMQPRSTFWSRFEQRDLSRFVGRKREIAILHNVLAQVERGHGHVVGLIGEAGAGKSRLLYEFLHRVHGTRVVTLQGWCRSYGSAMPYLPVLDIVRQHCGITDRDHPEAIQEKVRHSLQTVGLDPDEGAPYLLRLLGVETGAETLAGRSPDLVKARTLALLRQMMRHRGQRQPLLLIVEDLQWIDGLSEELVTALIEGLAGTPLFLLLTYRPGYQAPWMAQSYVTQLALPPLSPRDSLTVVRSVYETAQAQSPMVREILARAGGNPLFLEELALVMMHQAAPRSPVPVPDSIQGVLMARIDQLQEAPKRLLQTLAVLGRESPLRLIEAIWEGPEELLPLLLQELQRREFLYEQTGPEEPLYIFKHVLVQEVTYDSLILTRRQALHAATGQALEQLYADRQEVIADRLAYHYARTTEAEKAVLYLRHFAMQATRVYAHNTAAEALREALRHVDALPAVARHRRRLEIVLQLAQALSFLGHFGESLELWGSTRNCWSSSRTPSLPGRTTFGWVAPIASWAIKSALPGTRGKP